MPYFSAVYIEYPLTDLGDETSCQHLFFPGGDPSHMHCQVYVGETFAMSHSY